MTQPYYQDDFVTLFHGDCRDIVPTLGRFDLLLTDPPYGISYNAQKQNLPGAIARNDIAGDNNIKMAEWCISILNRVEFACIFGANNFPQIFPHRGRWICWDKRLTKSADKMLGSSFELAWTNKQSGYDKMIRVLHGGVVNSNGGKRLHPTEKPTQLFHQILDLVFVKANTIIDPFAGSGTTGRAAKDLGKKCTLIELEESYCEIAAKRMEQECFQFI